MFVDLFCGIDGSIMPNDDDDNKPPERGYSDPVTLRKDSRNAGSLAEYNSLIR